MALAEGRGVITQGCKTSTGGTVLQGVSSVPLMSKAVTVINMQATCPSCKKGIGNIVPISAVNIKVDNVQVALHGDIVACGCPYGSNTVIASSNAMQSQALPGGEVGLFKPL